MKKFISPFIISLLLFSSCQKQNTEEIQSKGTGTAADPYLIYSVADLKAMRDHVNVENATYGNKSYKLMANLDLYGDTASWSPIGKTTSLIKNSDATGQKIFTGTFDGNGKMIKGIHIGTTTYPVSSYYEGLFGYVDGGIIENLSVQWACLNAEGTERASCTAGGICGYINNGQITNCHSSGNFQGEYIGGICGRINYGQIKDCDFSGDITTSVTGGGIGGEIIANSISNCHSSGNITSLDSNSNAGGIGGFINASIINCYSTASITGTGACVGGIGGSIYSGIIINSYFTGSIMSNNINSFVGGIGGTIQAKSITNCYSTGNITDIENVNGWEYIGGIGGIIYCPTTNCYTAGNITSTGYGSDSYYVGGIAGFFDSYVSTNNCIALNNNISLDYGYVYRIGCFGQGATGNNNYASTTMIVKKGSTVLSNFKNTTFNGLDLSANPVDLLNNYVSANPVSNNISLLKWKVTAGINNGYPVFIN